MHYFHNFSWVSGGFAPDPTGAPSLDRTGGLSFPHPLLTSAGAHEHNLHDNAEKLPDLRPPPRHEPSKTVPAGGMTCRGCSITSKDNSMTDSNRDHVTDLVCFYRADRAARESPLDCRCIGKCRRFVAGCRRSDSRPACICVQPQNACIDFITCVRPRRATHVASPTPHYGGYFPHFSCI